MIIAIEKSSRPQNSPLLMRHIIMKVCPHLQRRNNIMIFIILSIILCMKYSFHSYINFDSGFFPSQKITTTGTIKSSEGSRSRITPAEESFSKLELFVSTFPGPEGRTIDDLKHDENDEVVTGFDELKSTFIRSLQYFWPLDKIRGVTVVLDDTACEKTFEGQARMTSEVKSFFRDDFDTKVNVRYNPRSDKTLYGKGWYIQQLCMFWADNFTDAEYIGFVDDDTLFTRAVHPTELFDELGRPHVIVRHMNLVYNKNWPITGYYAFQRPVLFNAMNYFPVIIKRDHLKDIRQAILEAHPEFSYFDEFYQELIKKPGIGRGWWIKECVFSQFSIMMDYCFFDARDSYSWHVEASPSSWRERKYSEVYSGSAESFGVTKEMQKPFPRVAVHANHIFFPPKNLPKLHFKENTKAGRDVFVTTYLRNGFCYSLRALLLFGHDEDKTNYSAEFEAHCTDTDYDDINKAGEWAFENTRLYDGNDLEGMVEAHAESMKRYAMQKSIRLRWDDI